MPLADQISRRHGVDIFSVGTGLAGATNVRRMVGKFPGIIVLLGDLGKGALAVIAAEFLGVEGVWIILPATAAIIGHWFSVFSNFRGGDGMGALGGVIIASFPLFGLASVAVAFIVSLGGQKMPYTSLLSIVFGYMALVMLSIAYNGNIPLTMGVGGLCALVLARAIKGHIERRSETDWDDLTDTDTAAEQSEFRP
ncbi:MAG: glycerol-3-phosphate acyltransferase [Chloroflexi bacterium]|nr:glycerol-3-phosphate acyltransferase [Chloroflexota bacterium]